MKLSNDQNGGAFIVRGMVYSLRHNEGDSDKAIADFSKAIKCDLIDPTEIAEAYRRRGSEYAFQKKYEKAIEDIQKALEMN